MRRMRCITLAILFMLFVVLSSSVMSISRAAGMKPANALAPIKGRDSVMVEVDSQGGVIFLLYSLPAPMLKELDEAFNGKKMKRIILGNAPNRANEGEPVLPVVPSQVIIPYGMTISKIDVKMGKKIALSGEHFIEYGKPVYPLIPDAQIKKGGPSDAIYGSDNAFPGKTHNFVSLQKKYGVSVAIVNLNPITYSPKSGKVYYYEDISLIIVTKPDSSNGKSKIRIRPEKFDPLQVGIENPEALDSYGGEWQESTIPFGTFNPLDSYQYVLITSEAIDDADTDVTVHDLIAQKQSRGLTAIIVTIEDIYDSFPGVDNAEKLRNAIIWYYNNWETDYVLLGGDINIIPMRKLWCQAY
ncbi:MAG: C25 family cysteine peptidase, partial [bacterium]